VQRLFVGDVQGCADELDELLERARRRFGDAFELWLVGDLVNRGPASLRVLRRVRELEERGRAHFVLGNHELALLKVGLGLSKLRPLDTFADVLEAPDADGWLEWLRHKPLAEAGEIEGRPFAMVHAAVHPDWSLRELTQHAGRAAARLGARDRERARAFLSADPARDPERDDLERLTECRSVGDGGTWSSQAPADPADAWHARWAARRHDYGVVYGHWSLQRLHVAPGLRGLDTGCVHHGRGRDGSLTAWLPDLARPGGRAPFAVPDDRFWHVPARRRYYPPPGAAAGASSRKA
jgi:bis(5'-nucleosyl)-tetraphosphatase (symmetrical)